jgi:hypothetical protein
MSTNQLEVFVVREYTEELASGIGRLNTKGYQLLTASI